MRHISIAFVLSTLLLVSICSAQQTSTSDNHTNSGQSASPIGGNGTAVISGAGAANYIPIWITPNYLQSSVIYQASGGNVGVGTTTPAATLDVNGAINIANNYQIGGNSVVKIGRPDDHNLFLGVGAGAMNTGYENVFSGTYAGSSNTTGTQNVFSGYAAGSSNTTGTENVFSGYTAGASNISGVGNTFYGYLAGLLNTTGVINTFLGYQAGLLNTTSWGNTFVGTYAGYGNTTGYYNIFYGYRAGTNNSTGNNNIYIGNLGPDSGSESNAIRIGGDLGSGYGPHTAAYILGIYGVNVGGVPVQINSNGQLGAQTSSLRFKEQVRDMGDSTSALMKLRPVTFLYKPEYDKGERTLQYGLIAEEVAKVYPELVANDNDGQPYSVRYQYITTMLLNEVQKQYHRAEAEAKVITVQEQKIDELERRLSRLESLIPQTVAQK